MRGRTSRRTRGLAWRLALIGMVAVIGLTGCGSSTTAPTASGQSAQPATAIPTATQTVSPSPTPAPIPQFVATGSTHTARMDATATLLQNGKVLIAGGSSSNGGTDALGSHGLIFASAELYDPATGKFTTTGSMSVRRVHHTATLLKDGRVLIAGGFTCSSTLACNNADVNALASAEIYNPKTGKFSPTGSMTTTRTSATATLLPDGKVLMAQGGKGLWAELYNPTSGQFVRTGKESWFTNPTATLLSNGKVLLTGGSGEDPPVAAHYDEASGKFTTISIASCHGALVVKYNGQVVRRAWPDPVTALDDGHVLFFDGGYLETYDPASGTCADNGFVSPDAQWLDPSGTLLPDGRVLFVGGLFEPAGAYEMITAVAVLYDPVSGSHVAIPLLAARSDHTATLLANGSVLIAGGEDANYNPLAAAERFKP
jgi:hypothetical protein